MFSSSKKVDIRGMDSTGDLILTAQGPADDAKLGFINAYSPRPDVMYWILKGLTIAKQTCPISFAFLAPGIRVYRLA